MQEARAACLGLQIGEGIRRHGVVGRTRGAAAAAAEPAVNVDQILRTRKHAATQVRSNRSGSGCAGVQTSREVRRSFACDSPD